MAVSSADARAVPLPACIDDKFLSTAPGLDNLQPDSVTSQTEFYVQSLQLYTITEEVLSAMYSNDAPTRAEPEISATEKLANVDFNNVLNLDASLQHWLDALPEDLKVRSNVNEDRLAPILSRQANILRLRCVPNCTLFAGTDINCLADICKLKSC